MFLLTRFLFCLHTRQLAELFRSFGHRINKVVRFVMTTIYAHFLTESEFLLFE